MKNFKANPEILLGVLSEPNNQANLKELINNILKIQFDKITVKPEIITLEKYFLSEPQYSILELEGLLTSGIKIQLAIKFIDRNKLKENSFLYWSYIFSKELEKYDEDEVFDGLMLSNRLRIYQANLEKYHDIMHIGIDNQPNGILHEGVELHFVDAVPYINYHEELYYWKQFHSYIKNDFLFLGMKLKEEILEMV